MMGPSFWKQGGQSTQQHHPQSTWQKKLKIPASVDKAMITVMWDCKGVILVNKNAARGDNQL